MSNSSCQRVSLLTSKSRTARALACSGIVVPGEGAGAVVGSGDGVGTGVDVGGTGVGVGVLVAVGVGTGVSVGSAVGVGVGTSPHADSRAAASKHARPIHTIGRRDPSNILRKRKANANACLLHT